MRASAQDRTIAAAFGIDHRSLGILLGGVAGATAAVAGMLFALANALTPATAFEWFGTVFAVVILGGIGHLVGTLVAGLLVGALSGVVSLRALPVGRAVRAVLRDRPDPAAAAARTVRAQGVPVIPRGLARDRARGRGAGHAVAVPGDPRLPARRTWRC